MKTNNGSSRGGGVQNATATSGRFDAAKAVVCIAYTDNMSVEGSSRRDLEIGCENNMVSSNQEVLDRAAEGSLAIVTSQSDDFVIGIVGKSVENCGVWEKEGGHRFRYARVFTPVTDILSKKEYSEKWDAVCQVLGCSGKNPKYLFHSRFCGYGTWYIPALTSALKCGVIPTK